MNVGISTEIITGAGNKKNAGYWLLPLRRKGGNLRYAALARCLEF
jgi:hypothetical protein